MNPWQSPPSTIVILGTCGGAAEACEIIREYGMETRIVFVNDVEPEVEFVVAGIAYPVVRDWDFTRFRRSEGEFSQFTIGMGEPRVKRLMVEKAIAAVLQPAPALLSHDVVVRPDVQLGRGVVVHPQSVLCSGVSVGDCVIIHKAMVNSDARIGAYATCAPHSTTGAGAEVGEGVYVGARAAIAAGASIAPWVRIGLNAAVRQDLPEPYTAHVGNPLRQLQQ